MIPDGISIAEIFDSEAHSSFFTDTVQFVNYLSSSYGVSITDEESQSILTSFGSNLPLSPVQGSASIGNAGAHKDINKSNKALTQNTTSEHHVMLSMFEINVIRYSLALSDTKPEDIDPFFLVDLMSLPETYYQADSYQKYGIVRQTTFICSLLQEYTHK